MSYLIYAVEAEDELVREQEKVDAAIQQLKDQGHDITDEMATTIRRDIKELRDLGGGTYQVTLKAKEPDPVPDPFLYGMTSAQLADLLVAEVRKKTSALPPEMEEKLREELHANIATLKEAWGSQWSLADSLSGPKNPPAAVATDAKIKVAE